MPSFQHALKRFFVHDLWRRYYLINHSELMVNTRFISYAVSINWKKHLDGEYEDFCYLR